MPCRGTAVLIMGPMRAGKTTAASFLGDKYGMERLAIAGNLKKLQRELCGDSLTKDREWLQREGAAHREVFGDDFWVDMLIKEISTKGYRSFVVDDVRYENEFERLYDYASVKYEQVIPVLVKSNLETQIIRGAEPILMNHHSETMARHLCNRIQTSGESEFVNILGIKAVVLDGNLPILEYYQQISRLIVPVSGKPIHNDYYRPE